MSQERDLEKYELIKKIEKNDPEILGELAEIILATRTRVGWRAVNVTSKSIDQINKEIREKLK